MYTGDRDHYFEVGRSALRCIEIALIAAERKSVERILDLPCGHGRVMRALKAAFPDASLTACDLDPDAVDFCARVFGATPVHSRKDPRDLEIDGRFDLIWCGSLFTHLDAPQWHGFLDLFRAILSDEGLLVFTAHGRHVVRRLEKRNFKHSLGLTESAIRELLREYDAKGFAYVNYAGSGDYGISAASPARVCELLQEKQPLKLVGLTERGFGARGLQDAYACLKSPGGAAT